MMMCEKGIEMTHGMDPDKMTGPERLAETSMLLSLAMMRLWLRRRSCAHQGASQERAFSRESGRDCLELSRETRLTVTAGKP